MKAKCDDCKGTVTVGCSNIVLCLTLVVFQGQDAWTFFYGVPG